MRTGNQQTARGYLRVSDAKQVDSYSLNAKADAIKRWCAL